MPGNHVFSEVQSVPRQGLFRGTKRTPTGPKRQNICSTPAAYGPNCPAPIVLPPFVASQHQHCRKFCILRAQDLLYSAGTNCQKNRRTLPALEVYKNQSPEEKRNSREKLHTPPSPHFWPNGIFQGRGAGVYILRSLAAGIFILYTPPLEGYFQGLGGVGVYPV